MKKYYGTAIGILFAIVLAAMPEALNLIIVFWVAAAVMSVLVVLWGVEWYKEKNVKIAADKVVEPITPQELAFCKEHTPEEAIVLMRHLFVNHGTCWVEKDKVGKMGIIYREIDWLDNPEELGLVEYSELFVRLTGKGVAFLKQCGFIEARK